jgi:hypothetical protein
MEVESTSSEVPPSTGPVILPGNRENSFVKEGEHVILVSNDKRHLFGVAKKNG